MITLLSDGQMIPCDDHTMCVRTVEERSWLVFWSGQVGCHCCFKSYTIIAPQSFSGGGLVFKRKLVTVEGVWWVTMERVWWVTMIVHEGLLWISIWFSSLCLVYRSYVHVTHSHDRDLTVVGYCGYWWCLKRIYCQFHHCAWYIGHTCMWHIPTTVIWQWWVTVDIDDAWTESIVIFIIVLGI